VKSGFFYPPTIFVDLSLQIR